jgi:hypothetical protein
MKLSDASHTGHTNAYQRLMGASLLIFLNKTDVGGCMSEREVQEVGSRVSYCKAPS